MKKTKDGLKTPILFIGMKHPENLAVLQLFADHHGYSTHDTTLAGNLIRKAWLEKKPIGIIVIKTETPLKHQEDYQKIIKAAQGARKDKSLQIIMMTDAPIPQTEWHQKNGIQYAAFDNYDSVADLIHKYQEKVTET